MVAKRGRPSKKEVREEPEIETTENLEEVETSNTENLEEVEVLEKAPLPPDDSSVIGEGTAPDYNPFAENVVEREYSSPKIASGLVDEINEPQFVPPTYEDIKARKDMEGMEDISGDSGGSFDDLSNPALNDLTSKDKKIACESLVDTCLDTYEQLHKFAQYSIKVDEDELMVKHQQGKIDLNEQIPVTETQNMSVGEFMAQFNTQTEEALSYDPEFGVKIRPAMIRVFMKRGYGMSDEQFLMYMLSKDIAIKVGIMYQLKKTIASTIEQLEKAHKQNKARGYSTPEPPPPVVKEKYQASEEVEDEEFDEEFEDDIIVDEGVPKKAETYGDSMNIQMPLNPKDPLAQHPSAIKKILRKKK
jgi:hypothetical protein